MDCSSVIGMATYTASQGGSGGQSLPGAVPEQNSGHGAPKEVHMPRPQSDGGRASCSFSCSFSCSSEFANLCLPGSTGNWIGRQFPRGAREGAREGARKAVRKCCRNSRTSSPAGRPETASAPHANLSPCGPRRRPSPVCHSLENHASFDFRVPPRPPAVPQPESLLQIIYVVVVPAEITDKEQRLVFEARAIQQRET